MTFLESGGIPVLAMNVIRDQDHSQHRISIFRVNLYLTEGYIIRLES